MRSVSPMSISLDDLEARADAIKEELRVIKKTLRQESRQAWHDSRRRLEAEIADAHNQHKHAGVHRLIFLLAAQHGGPRKRKYNLPSTFDSRTEWQTQLSLPADGGGMGA
eukprot:9493466-Pyramimonas_sp.AAC.1